MFVTNLAYIHQNGEVEGFSGSSFIKEISMERCIQKIKEKCQFLNQPFDEKRLIRTSKQAKSLTKDQMETIRKHWSLE